MVDSYFPSILTTMFIRALLGYLFYSGSPDRDFVVEFSGSNGSTGGRTGNHWGCKYVYMYLNKKNLWFGFQPGNFCFQHFPRYLVGLSKKKPASFCPSRMQCDGLWQFMATLAERQGLDRDVWFPTAYGQGQVNPSIL